MRYLFLILATLTLTGCSYNPWRYEEGQWFSIVDTDELSRVVIDYTTKLYHDRHLRLEHSYVYYDDEIKKIRLEFITQDILELKEARDLLVDVVEGFLERLDQDWIVSSELSDPFTADNLNIYINLESYWGLYGDPFYVGWIVLERGLAFYYAFDVKDNKIDWWHSRVEPYYKSHQYVVFEREAEERYRANLPPPPPTKLSKERYRED